MKHAIQFLVLAGALCACGDQYADTLAAARESDDRNLPSIEELEQEEAASEAAEPTSAAVDPLEIDTRDTSPESTDSTFEVSENANGISNKEKGGSAMSDALIPPGAPSPHAIPPQISGDTVASKPGTSTAGPKDAVKGLGPIDTDFVSKAILGGLFEVQSSELAVSKASTPFVREFAQMLVLDHGDANRELGEIVRGKGGSVPTELDADHQGRLTTLRDLKGVDFDRQYRDMQVSAHTDAIVLFEKASNECEDAELKAFATKVLPTLRMHQGKLNEMPPTQGF